MSEKPQKSFEALKEMDTATLSQLVLKATEQLDERQRGAIVNLVSTLPIEIPRPKTDKALQLCLQDSTWDNAGKTVSQCGDILKDSGLAFNIHCISTRSATDVKIQIVMTPVPQCLHFVFLLDGDDAITQEEIIEYFKSEGLQNKAK